MTDPAPPLNVSTDAPEPNDPAARNRAASDRAAAPRRPRDRRPIARFKKGLFAVVATCGFFLLVEATLFLIGVGDPEVRVDPFVGFDQQFPLMSVSTNASGARVVSTSPNKWTWFNLQSFPLDKRDNVKRIFCVGGSTTYGRPYDDLISYTGWLREFLSTADPNTEWQVINAGGVSYASYRVAAVMEELAQYEPDLFIVYTAHNEFLEQRTYPAMFETPSWPRRAQSLLIRTRTWSAIEHLVNQIRSPTRASPAESLSGDRSDASEPVTTGKEILPGEVDEILNHSIGPASYHRDDRWREKVIRHYELNLRRIVAIASDADAGLLFVTPAANEMDCSPFKSELSSDLNEEQITQFRQQRQTGQTELDNGDEEAALKSFQRAAAIDPRFAELRYEIGKLQFRLGRKTEAEQSFAVAINEDVCPLRAIDEIDQSIRRVAEQRQVPLLDFNSRLRDKSRSELGHRCLGGAYFLDHVHPTIDVHRQLALWLLETMNDHGLAATKPLTSEQLTAIDARVRSQIDQTAHGIALRNLAKVLHWSGKFDEAIPLARDAIRTLRRDPESQYILADCLVNRGQFDRGWREYERLFSSADFPPAYVPFAEVLMARGENARAKNYLALAAVVYEDRRPAARVHFLRGYILVAENEFEEAVEALLLSNQIVPGDPQTLMLLGEAQAGAGQTATAIDTYRRVLAIGPRESEVHNRLGLLFMKTRQFDRAVEHLKAAVEIDPADTLAAQNLAVARHFAATEQPPASTSD